MKSVAVEQSRESAPLSNVQGGHEIRSSYRISWPPLSRVNAEPLPLPRSGVEVGVGDVAGRSDLPRRKGVMLLRHGDGMGGIGQRGVRLPNGMAVSVADAARAAELEAAADRAAPRDGLYFWKLGPRRQNPGMNASAAKQFARAMSSGTPPSVKRNAGTETAPAVDPLG